MDRLKQATENLARRKHRVRSRVQGTAARPRLTIYISNQHITAQIIDDTNHNTLVYVTTVGNKKVTGTMSQKATIIGTEVGKKAKTAKVKMVVLDRNGRLYHGRIKALADAARAEGLGF